MSDGEGSTESVVLDDGTRRGRVAHGAQFGQSQRVTFVQLRVTANVLPVPVKSVQFQSLLNVYLTSS